MLEHAPRFGTLDAEQLARDFFGVDARAAALPSERDQNFLLESATPPGLVLKIANALEDRAVLQAQQRAVQHVAPSFPLVPAVLRTTAGDTITETRAPGGPAHLIWGISQLPGRPLAELRHRSPALLRELGRTVANLTNALDGFDDPALHREFHWDLARGRETVATYRPLVADPALGAAIDTLVERFERHTAPALHTLRNSVIHNDLNDYNVLVDGTFEAPRISGIVDFGDMLHGPTVGELAVAVAYMVLDARDPLSALWEMVHGYHAVRPMQEPELRALFGLLAMRLCLSACIGAHQQRARPDNEYLSVSQAALRRTLPRLARIPFAFAEATARDACGLEPIASSARVRAWLAAHSAGFAPVLGTDLRSAPTVVLDLSVGSPLIAGDSRENSEPALTQRIRAVMHAAGAPVGIGRYNEPRLVYTAPFFANGDGTLGERRTIHIGLDLFADAGTPVFAPMDGTVHAFGEFHVEQDYGPVIVLRHTIDDGTEFFTLYGHLSCDSLADLRAGKSVKRGERIASLGTPEENVGWPPHLHLQIITDFLEFGADFPGVGTASRRAVWRSVSPDPNVIVGVPASRFPAPALGKGAALAERRARIGANLSIAYHDPVRLARGWRQYVYDDDGRRYIDAYNNVPHVGHAHPRVVDAVAAQMAVLSTNTRYVHDGLVAYAERLAETLPDPLKVCFFLSSASEANELALRLARAATGARDMIVLDAAYHGNTTSLIDISPYKHAGPGGSGAPDWVHVAPIADDYRGAYKRDNRAAGVKYAQRVAEIIGALGPRKLAGFIAETCPSVGGQIVFPAGYLRAVYEHVRAAGGVCIADEVQTGLGRMGTHFWAFEAQDVVPDIVVMGKPLGNGHPLAAVVTTRAIADAFDNGMEFFSTFGGNTVSCAAGLAVLDVVRDEALQAHALRVGEHLLARLRALMSRHALVGDVRGSGLFLGVELVRDRNTLEPATAEASYVANRMRDEGILLGTDGPHHNVIKIRPPMPFDTGDGDVLVDTLDRVLSEVTTWDV